MVSSEEWRSELDERLAQFRRIVDELGCDATIVFGAHGHAEHFRYLTNFAPALGDAWLLTHGRAQPFCVLDFDWQVEEARRRSGIGEWRSRFQAAPLVAELLAGVAPRRVAVAGLDRLPVTAWEIVRSRLGELEVVDVAPSWRGCAGERARSKSACFDRLDG